MGHRVLIASALLAAFASAAAAEPAGRITGTVTVSDPDGKVVSNAEVVVYVVGYGEPADPTAPAVKIEQKQRKFVPELVAVTQADRVEFPNVDPFLHNVFSQSAARKFDLGSFKRGESKTKDFPGLGVIDVYCNIHPEMAATVLVVPNRRHARVGADGNFTIEGVRPGNWTVFAYTRRAVRPVSVPVSVTDGQIAVVKLAIARGAEGEHLNKYGEKYHDAGGTYR